MILRPWRYIRALEDDLLNAGEDIDRLSQEKLHQAERILRLKADNDRLRHRMGILHPDEDAEYDTRPYRPYVVAPVDGEAT